MTTCQQRQKNLGPDGGCITEVLLYFQNNYTSRKLMHIAPVYGKKSLYCPNLFIGDIVYHRYFTGIRTHELKTFISILYFVRYLLTL